VGRLVIVVLEGRAYQVAEGDFPSVDVPTAPAPNPEEISATNPDQDTVALDLASPFSIWDKLWNWLRSLARSLAESA
jgi:hypothetical protein